MQHRTCLKGSDFMSCALTLFLTFIAIVLIPYAINSVITYKLAQKAGLRHEVWKAWVPVLQTMLLLHIIDKSGWNALWLLVPIANIIFLAVWYIDLLERFGQNPLWVITYFLPGTNLVFVGFLFYMAFSDKVYYISSNKYQNKYFY